MVKNKIKIQCIMFDNKKFNKSKIKVWIAMNGFKIDNRLRKPIEKCDNVFRVRQRQPSWFNKKTFIVKSLGVGIKGVYGKLRR